MISIREITLFDCIFDFKLVLPPLGTYLVRRSVANEGIMLGAYYGEMPVGMAVMEFATRPLLTYLFVEERFRGQGTGTKLANAAVERAKSKCIVELEAYVVMQNEYAEAVDRLLQKTGFQLSDTATIVRYANDEKCGRQWALLKAERVSRICSALERRGYKTMPFSEISPEVFEKLRAALDKDFPSNLNPFSYITNNIDRVVPDYSFVTLKDGEPAAFVTVTTADGKSLVFQQLSSAFKHQGNGVFLLPFAAFMEKFLTGDSYKKVTSVIFDNNYRMKRLVHSFIGMLAESMKTQNVYRCELL